MDMDPIGEDEPAPNPPDGDRSEWLPVLAGFAGLFGGAVVGGALGLSNGLGNALQLAVVGGFIGMVMVLVPVTSRRRLAEDDDRPSQKADQPVATPLEVISSMRRAKKPSHALTPEAGLEVRPVPNKNSEPTGRIRGGTVVQVIRRSGNWASVEATDDTEGDGPFWVRRRDLEPFEEDSAAPDNN
jgi:hypothetical protein